MAFDLTEPLVIGISSRALFNLEEENRIFETQGLDVYQQYQVSHESDTLPKGAAFQLVKAFLRLNELSPEKRLVEVIVMSRNSPDTSLRIFKSIRDYGLDISRACLVSGAPMTPYLKAFKTDLFLSAYEEDVRQAINNGIAAGRIITAHTHSEMGAPVDQIRIAFDGDAVLFGSESEKIYQKEGIAAFIKHEQANATVPMNEGPFANFLRTLAHLQGMFATREESPIRTALVTSRNALAHERAIRTLRGWNVRVDEAFFLGGVRKKEILAAFGAHIFFDDQNVHTDPASEVVTAAQVPYADGQDPRD